MRSPRSLVLIVVVGSLLATGCSQSSSDDAGDGDGTSAAAAQTDAATYVDGVCTALNDWQSSLDADNQDLQALLSGTDPSPEETKTGLVTFLTATVEGTKTMASDIESLGVPDVEGGAEIASTLSSAFDDVVAQFQGALDDVEALSTDDQKEMTKALAQVGSDISEGSSGIGEALGDLDTSQLNEAAKNSQACGALTA
jgi:hypothetical protein